jgi:hypothetical protein
MRFKNKGRKIYKTKEKNYYGKTPAAKAFSVGLTVLLIGGIGFLGYSAAEPVINYTKKKGDNTISTLSTDSALTPASTPVEATGGNAELQVPLGREEYRAAAFTPVDLTSVETLKAALRRIPDSLDIEYVEVPLKVSGGELYYMSSVYYATQTGAIKNMISLKDIVDTIEGSGYKSAAMVSTFKDYILPIADRRSGYITAETDEQWIDNDYESGGKPWTSPFSQMAVDYNGEIVDEIASAGFDKIICTDMIFPDFRESDLEILPRDISAHDRYKALTAAANLYYDKALSHGSTMAVEIKASDILKGNKDVISEPLYLNVNSIILNIDIDEISYGVYTSSTVYEFKGTAAEKTKTMLSLVRNELKDYSNVTVRLSGVSVTPDELVKAKEVIGEFGFTSFVIG